MLDFSSIAPHLQIGIAEKIDYFDRREFELSSKRGKVVIDCTKHKAMIALRSIDVRFDDIYLNFMQNSTGQKLCRDLLQFSDLPLFKVTKIDFYSDIPLDSLVELYERQLIVANEVYLFWKWWGGIIPNFSTLSDIFLKFFNVKTLVLEERGPLDDNLFSLPKFHEISTISMNSAEIPDEKLLQLQARRIRLGDQAENRICVTTILFLKQWLMKKRHMEWFQIGSPGAEEWRSSMNEEIVSSGLPYSVIWQYSEDQKNTTLNLQKRMFDPDAPCEIAENWEVDRNTMVYSIDGGDRKLLVVVGPYGFGREVLIAQEYSEIDDVIKIQRH